MLHDCFGRERHKDHREDMSGVGCVDDPCRTLYVAGIKRNPLVNLEQEVKGLDKFSCGSNSLILGSWRA